MTDYYLVQPLDVLMLRGNKSFGDAGEHGEAQLPPWPSVFAGAFRSALLGQDAAQLARFAAGERLEGALGACLGTPTEPGAFRIAWVSLARAHGGGVSAAAPLPADLAAFRENSAETLITLQPTALPRGLCASEALPMHALLRVKKQTKPSAGWLDQVGLNLHLAGDVVPTTFPEAELYKREMRLGIALDPDSRTAAEGALYTAEALAFTAEAGFLVGIEGALDLLPEEGLLRLAGDGKGARYRRVPFAPPESPRIETGGRFRLILSTPGVFEGGWLPDRVERQAERNYRLRGPGFSARLACAAVPRFEVVSGWDLAQWCPKTAQRVAPAGSVYWFDEFEGEPSKLAEWVAGGLWGDICDRQRRAEGFNLAWLGAWSGPS